MSAPTSENFVLLAVDDRPDNLFVLESLVLEGVPDCRMVKASNAKEGLALAAATPIDGAIIDVQMPVMGGIEMCRQLKAHPATRGIPVILVTAHQPDAQLRAEGLDAGASDFIVKPIDNAELIARIKVMIRIRAAEERLRASNVVLDNLLRESHEALRAVFESSTDFIMLLDRDHRVQLINRTEEGLEMKDIVGRLLSDFVTPENQARVRGHLERITVYAESQQWETTYTRPGGEVVRFQSNGAPIFREGVVTGAVVTSRDVSARMRLEAEKVRIEAQFHESQKMESIGRLAGGVAHDFNNMLTVINSHSEFALSELPEAHPCREDLEEVMAASGRATALTRQLLAFCSKQVMEPQVLDLNEVVGDLEKMLRRLIGEQITFSTTLADNLGRVLADPSQVEQVLMNLVVNARDAMPAGGGLTIETANIDAKEAGASGQVMLLVRDDGGGMSAEVQDKIFEPFFTTKAQGRGTGLGLATVFGIVKQFEGDIEVDSRPGGGSTFKVFLPRVEAEKTVRSAPRSKPQGGGNETILVVEDEEIVRRLTLRILESVGYTVIAAADGREALRICQVQGQAIDLVLSDVVMPNMSGRELSAELEALLPDLRVLFMSGYTDEPLDGGLSSWNEANFIAKPFRPPDLIEKVRSVLSAG